MDFWEELTDARVGPHFARKQENFGEIRRIVLDGSADVFVKIGPAGDVHLAAKDEAALEGLRVWANGSTLSVDTESIAINIPGLLTANVKGSVIVNGQQVAGVSRGYVGLTVPELDELVIAGSGEAEILGLDQRELRLSVRGAGNVRVTGKIGRLMATISGAGNVEAEHLLCDDAQLEVRGAGNVYAHVRKSVAASVRGVGEILIAGNPPQVESRVSGLGRVRVLPDRESSITVAEDAVDADEPSDVPVDPPAKGLMSWLRRWRSAS